MLARRPSRLLVFTRRDAARLTIATVLLVVAMAFVLSVDLLPTGTASTRPDLAEVVGWLLLSGLLVGSLLAWVWRFRPELWHRNRPLALLAVLLLLAAFLLRLT